MLHKGSELNSYLFPFAVDALWGDGGVGVCPNQLDAVALCNESHLLVDRLDSIQLLMGFIQSGFELLMGCDQTLGKEKSINIYINIWSDMCFLTLSHLQKKIN